MAKGRISFNARDAEHIYEYLVMYWDGYDSGYRDCVLCRIIGKRLETFIGPKEVRRVKAAVKANP